MAVSRNQGYNDPPYGAVLPSGHRPREQWPWEAECCRSHALSWTSVLLLLLVHLSGCGPQRLLHQPPLASSPLGTTIRLTCTLSRNHNINVYSIYWYQQRPGHPPRFLLRFSSHLDKLRGPSISSRFSGSKDVARNQAYLRISELQPEDEAVYYCAVGPRGQGEKRTGRERGGEK